MATQKPDGLAHESIVLTYIGQHPDATKYELAKNLRTHAHLDGIPYSTISLWIKLMQKREEIVAKKLGPTRAGLTKTGYRITPKALYWISYALDTQQFMKLVREHEESLPLPAELIEKAIRSTGNAPKVIQAVADLKIQDKKSDFDNYFTGLVLNTLWDLEFDDPNVQQQFVSAVIRAAAETNADLMNGRDFASSMGSLIEEESWFLANATRTLAIVKDEAQKLSRS
jgi:hypothetical protein